jgi:hypothetical protein
MLSDFTVEHFLNKSYNLLRRKIMADIEFESIKAIMLNILIISVFR